MSKKSILNLASLKDQVYEYIRLQMKIGTLKPGDSIDMNAFSQRLGVSKTPLRDALIRLEMEGFVWILPRRGVIVNELTIQDIKDYYQILGALESTAVIAAAPHLKEIEVRKMDKLNQGMGVALGRDDFNAYYEKNLQFHDIFLTLSGNKQLRNTADVLKKRLYDFPRQAGYVREWEEHSIQEHKELIRLIAERKYLEAANFIRDVHWSFAVQQKFVTKYYTESPEE
ncbi:MAG: GntR family transcriptional regulator [Candidatus Aminicenantaceae bacterium]